MPITTEEFVSSFDSIEGFTLRERYIQFSSFLDKVHPSLNNEIVEINFADIKPKNALQDSFKIKTLIYLRRTSDLLEVLKGGNLAHIAKILKVSNLFLEEAFKNINKEELIKNVLPYMSYRTKMRVFHKLCLYLNDTEKAEDYFEEIRQHYGLHLAVNLIPCCGSEFILKLLETNRIEFTPAQLVIIIKKHSQLTEEIFEVLSKYNNKVGIGKKYANVFIYLIRNDPSLFLKLNEKYRPDFRLGRRATKHFIEFDKVNVIHSARTIYKLLHKKQTIKSMNNDFDKFFINLFPTTLSECKEEYKNILSLLKRVPLNASQFNLLLITFKKKFGSELLDHPTFITPQLFEIMPSDDRHIWIQNHSRPNKISEELWISFLKTDKSLALLKKRISFTSNVKLKARIASYLVKTCKLNNDELALKDCYKFILTQCNDQNTVRIEFLNAVLKYYDLLKFDKEHWAYIMKILELNVLNDEDYPNGFKFLEAFIEYRLTMNQPIEDQLELWAKLRCDRIDLKNQKHQKTVLQMLGNFIADDYALGFINHVCVKYFESLIDWNKSHPKDQIPYELYRNAILYLKASLKENNLEYGTEKVLKEYIKNVNMDEMEKHSLLNAFFACKDNIVSGVLMKWLLESELEYVIHNITIITKRLLETHLTYRMYPLWIVIKKYSHVGLPQKVCEVCITVLNNMDGTDNQILTEWCNISRIECAVSALSYLMDTNEFISFVKSYYPSVTDVRTTRGMHISKIQRSITMSIKNIVPLSDTFQSLLSFSNSEYIGFVLKTVNIILLDVPEMHLSSFLIELFDGPVILKKCVICFVFRYAGKPEVLKMIARLGTSRYTLFQKCLFKGAFSFFINNPDDYFWNLLKETVITLNLNDREATDILLRWNKIPVPYLTEYIIFIWNISEKNSNLSVDGMCTILDAISTETIPMLPEEFTTAIIKTHFFKSGELNAFQLKINELVFKYIICSSRSVSEQQQHLKLVFEILEDNMASSYMNINTYKALYDFVKEFCSYFLENKICNVELFQIFSEMINNLLNSKTTFIISLYLQFTSICLNCKTLNEIGEKLQSLFTSLLKDHGPTIINGFHKVLKLFIPYLITTGTENPEENQYYLIKNIIESERSVSSLILVIFLIPDKVINLCKFKNKYLDIINSLLQEKDFSVQICLRQYLLNKERLIMNCEC